MLIHIDAASFGRYGVVHCYSLRMGTCVDRLVIVIEGTLTAEVCAIA